MEITYPLPEALSASLVNIMSQVGVVKSYVVVMVIMVVTHLQIFNLFLVFFIGKYYHRIGMWTTVAFIGCAAVLAG